MGLLQIINKPFKGIKIKEVLMLLGVYVLLSFFYKIILQLNRRGIKDWKVENDVWYNSGQWFIDGGLQHIIMFVISCIVWVLIFRVFRKLKLWQRLLLHIITLPLFVWFAQQGYYHLCDFLNMNHLMGSGQVWDIFIPTLVYLVQFSLLHAYEYYVVNQQKLQLEIELKNNALKSELSALKAQLNPHFLYNVFNTINASVPPEMEQTREMIAGLSDLFRYQLKASKEDEVTLGEELDFVKQYLDLEKLRFENRLEIKITVCDSLLSKKIPPMILQPLVENSVKHGISPLVEGGKIEIEITEEGGKLIFEISDTGLGIQNKTGIFEKGVGLGNTQSRLQKTHQTSIELMDNLPRGLRLRFSI